MSQLILNASATSERRQVAVAPRDRTAPTASAPAAGSELEWRRFAWLALQLVGLNCLVDRFQVESPAFIQVFMLASAGFVVQYFLPLRFRLAFFLALSVASMVLVLGAGGTAWLAAIGLALLGLVHAPASWPVRIGALLAAGLGLAGLRSGWIASPTPSAIWPILGAMFMFRLVAYAYDVRHGQAPQSWMQRLAYFFMLPNVCFPLFPVVDSRTFERTYFAGERHDIYQRGIEWILRGVIQLLLYRIAYNRLGIDPYDISTAADLIHYSLWLFSLYLRVSGQFHVIVGMLHLFGFQLPETHRRYYFASSFTDFWRRINIYWKDFMMKVFYYPMFFRTKGLGPTRALVISTAFVFAMTWALHAYQLFWIRGSYTFTWNDFLFWTILCGLVTVNALWEAKRGRKRSLTPKAPSLKDHAVNVVKTLATFVVICLLWTFWSSESLSAWWALWPAALSPPTPEQYRVMAAIAAGGVATLLAILAWDRWFAPRIQRRWDWRAACTLTQLFVLNLLSITAVYGSLGAAGPLVAAARYGGLNRADMAQFERGYYEDLLTVDRFNSDLAALYAKRPADWSKSIWEAGLVQPAEGLSYELRPNAAARFKGAMLRTNQWGMHDQEYPKQKPDGCVRIALLGASHTMGSGVEREKTFDAVLEQRLNGAFRESGNRFEVLNFAVYGYSPLEQLRVLETRVLPFECDVVMYVGHPGDVNRVAHQLSRAISAGFDFGHTWIDEIVARANAPVQSPARLIHRQLQPHGEELLTTLYRRMTALCRANEVHPVFVHLPMVPEGEITEARREIPLARDAGFSIFDLDSVYDGHNRASLWIAEWDAHPNALGHDLIAERLFQLISEQQHVILGVEERQAPPGAERDIAYD